MFSHIGIDVKSNGDYLSMIRGVFSADEGVCIETVGVIKGGVLGWGPMRGARGKKEVARVDEVVMQGLHVRKKLWFATRHFLLDMRLLKREGKREKKISENSSVLDSFISLEQFIKQR